MSSLRVGFIAKAKVLLGFQSSSSVALTFDDGPDPKYTPQLLEILRRYGARATFFVLGRQAELYPGILKEIVDSGSEIANHTYSHPSFWSATGYAKLQEIRGCERAIGKRCKKYFRAPHGHAKGLTPFLASMLGYTTIGWTVTARDWEVTDPEALAMILSYGVRPGSILLLHDRLEIAQDVCAFDRSYMLAGLDIYLRKHGSQYSFQTISEMLATSEAVFGKAWDSTIDRGEMEWAKRHLTELVRNQG
jgi:peptidoglycan/xylan/chitin deacetylase (PgdA/CDA1 family)